MMRGSDRPVGKGARGHGPSFWGAVDKKGVYFSSIPDSNRGWAVPHRLRVTTDPCRNHAVAMEFLSVRETFQLNSFADTEIFAAGRP